MKGKGKEGESKGLGADIQSCLRLEMREPPTSTVGMPLAMQLQLFKCPLAFAIWPAIYRSAEWPWAERVPKSAPRSDRALGHLPRRAWRVLLALQYAQNTLNALLRAVRRQVVKSTPQSTPQSTLWGTFRRGFLAHVSCTWPAGSYPLQSSWPRPAPGPPIPTQSGVLADTHASAKQERGRIPFP